MKFEAEETTGDCPIDPELLHSKYVHLLIAVHHLIRVHRIIRVQLTERGGYAVTVLKVVLYRCLARINACLHHIIVSSNLSG